MRGSLLRYMTFYGENNVSETIFFPDDGEEFDILSQILRQCYDSFYPFLLSVRGAKIYDLGENPVGVKHWTQLADVRLYYEF